MMESEQKKKRYGKIASWLPNLYYIGTLVSLFFILAQVMFARHSVVESSEWEKAKMTIENIERFREALSNTRLGKSELWWSADGLLPDYATEEGFRVWEVSLYPKYLTLFDSRTDTLAEKMFRRTDVDQAHEEILQLIDIMDAFAYPIIMGYASEEGSSQSVIRQYYTYGGFVMAPAFHEFRNIGHHAKMLYRLWRLKFEMMYIDQFLADPDIEVITEKTNYFLYYDEAELTLTSLKKYRKTLDRKLKEMRKEIDIFREGSLN